MSFLYTTNRSCKFPKKPITKKAMVLIHSVWNNDAINTWHYSSQMEVSLHIHLYLLKIALTIYIQHFPGNYPIYSI